VYWREESKQPSLDSECRRLCLACRTLDPPTEPAYGCPECGEGATLSRYGGEIPDVCPACGDGKLELITESACALCGEGEVEEREIIRCPYCGYIRLSKHEYHSCPSRPVQARATTLQKDMGWTPGGDGKGVYLRLECRAREDRVKVNGRFCPGWRRLVERFHGGNKDAFKDCVLCAYGWGNNPGRIEAMETEPYPYQEMFKV
jgi:DNA-directed RNA polymerase subunit RPC12/RpoP